RCHVTRTYLTTPGLRDRPPFRANGQSLRPIFWGSARYAPLACWRISVVRCALSATAQLATSETQEKDAFLLVPPPHRAARRHYASTQSNHYFRRSRNRGELAVRAV